jgi:hypothetical protein
MQKADVVGRPAVFYLEEIERTLTKYGVLICFILYNFFLTNTLNKFINFN